MKKFYLIFALLAISYGGISQELSHHVISSAGDEASNGNIQLNWTLGELATTTLTSTDETLTQGFQQAELIRVNTREVREFVKISAYPNPFDQYVNIQKDTDQTLYVECIDLLGRTLKMETLTQETQTLHLDELASAMYFLKITNEQGELMELIKIQKR